MNNENAHQDERDDDTGAEREASENADKLPAQPNDDDSPAGDTDQHSSSNA